ncbi:MAG: hypothetical protein ABJ275_11915 [Maricaulaceae bacterium]
MNMLPNWSDDHSAAFQKSALTFKHNLNSTGLFTDEALIALLEKHPREEMDVCAMPLPGDTAFRTGDFRNADGKTLLDIAKTGAIWINLRRAMNIHPEYKQALDEMYGSLSERTGLNAFNPRGGILISSPLAVVPYHFDKTETILWHVRGKKSLLLYPLNDEYFPEEAFEETIINPTSDDLPYKPEFENGVQTFKLDEDQAITWPLNTPHRVINETFCVSVTTEYSTAESGRKNAAILTNATLRRKFGFSPSYAEDSEMTRSIKSILGRVLKKTGLGAKVTRTDYVTFEVRKGDQNIYDVTPFERNF